MFTNLSASHSLISTWLRELRDKDIQQDRARFRRNIERIGEVAAYEISKLLDFKTHQTQTPLGESATADLSVQPVLATILRAGLPLHQGLLNYFDKADCAFAAAYRKHHTDGSFEIEQHYLTSPSIDGRPFIIADPMLATGASLILATNAFLENGKPSQLHIVSVIASAQGVAAVQQAFPDAYIWTAAIDEELTSQAYIFPGLGDAGDLSFGSKRQS